MTDEAISLMEPLIPSETKMRELDDLVLELTAKSNRLAGQLHPIVQASISNLVRSMNCYYSNLIEGHNTHPRDIDKALAEQYSKNKENRDLQKEAVAHIAVQRMIDFGEDPKCHPASIEYMLWLHKEFCSRLPKDLLFVENEDTGEKLPVIAGKLRDNEVVVGRHIPPLHENLEKFLKRFEEIFTSENLSKSQQIISVGAAHHRLLWIHPFLDGNGRVTRFVSHSMLLRLSIGSSLWSVSRGLARNVTEYKKLLMEADGARQGDRDGRGTLSEKALIDFCKFFLQICIDQVEYMDSLIQPSQILRRIELYTRDEIDAGRLPKGSLALLREALLIGEFERGRASEITGYKDRTARKVLSELVEKKLLISNTPKGAVRLNFPFEVVEHWFPRLYPE